MTRDSPRADLRAVGAPVAPPGHDARGLAWLAAVLVVVALALGVALAFAGEAWPSPGSLALFALLAWFAVNRYTFFPSELAVTSESAVLLAAVVVFRGDAPLLGPWCVAALLGPLDAVHWEHRAFSRMGYNAAHQMLAVVAAGAASAAVTARVGASVDGWIGAGVAVVVYALVVVSIGVVAQRVWARVAVADALRELLALDWIVVPLGVLGACAGAAAITHGWWALPLVLVPAAFVPEVVLGHGRSLAAAFVASVRVRVAVVVLAGALLVAPVAAAIGGGAVVALGVLVLGGLAAVELVPPRPARVPPLAGVVVAVGVAVVGLGAPWWSPARTLGALGAGVVVAGAAALTAPAGARRAEVARAGWALPVFSGGVAAAIAVVRTGPAAVATPVAVVVASAALVAAWAAPPWHSSVLSPALGPRRFTARRVVLGALVATALVAGAAGARSWPEQGEARVWCALIALVATEVALAVAAAGARQWRYDPARRRVLVGLVVVTSVAVLVGLPLLARRAPEWIVAVAAVAGAVAFLVGDTPARLGDDAARAVDDELGAG